jgi:hypothetical protein
MEAISSIRDLVNLWPTRSSLVADLGKTCPGLKVTTPQVHKWASNGSIPAKYHFPILMAARLRGFSITADRIAELHAPPIEDAA